MITIDVPALPPNNASYSQAVRIGDLIFVSGQIGIDPLTRALAPGGIQPETRQAIDNVATVLAAAGSSLDRVVKVNIFITDFVWLAPMNEIFAARFPQRPAKTTVEIARLDKDALIEIEVVAAS